jgi:hypothetical protein
VISLGNHELGTLAFCRVGSDPYGDLGWFNDVLHINIPEREFISAYREIDPL